MRISPISIINSNHQKVLKNQNKQKVSDTSYSPSFSGNYLEVYRSVVDVNLGRSYSKVEQIF